MFAALLHYDDMDELACIGAPTLLIWGDADSVVPRQMQAILADRLPRAELVVYPSVGHTPRWEDSQRFSDDLAAFVERVQAGT